MKYGYFDDARKEYVITNPATPTPWINYLSNSEYCAMISNTAGGYSFHIDPKDRRILRYRYNNLPPDRPGRYLYVRDNKTGKYWSPTWQPVPKKLSTYECRHGLGYTRISSSYDGVEAEATYFVPLDENLEIWMLTLKNAASQEKELTVFSYAEFCLWHADRDQNDLQSIQGVGVAKYEEGVVFHHFFDLSTGYAFFFSSGKVTGYDCSREEFIGPYRSESNPLAVDRGQCFDSGSLGGNPIAATSNPVRLSPGQAETIIFVLGVAKEKPEAKKCIQKLRQKSAVDKEFRRLGEYWDTFLAKFTVDTPDKEFDSLVSVWNQYQCRTTFDWSRYVSFYETGIGRGMGFRDCNQDTLGVVHAIPERVRRRILDLTKNQFKDGHAYHIYYPLTGEGGFPNYAKEKMRFFSDDHLWLILSVCEYIKETGDLAILSENVNFVDGSSASLYEHLKRALDFTLGTMGSHDLPLLGTADWNDPLSLPGPNDAAESVFVAMLFHKVLLELSELCKEHSHDEDSKRYVTIAEKTKAHVNEIAWDGNWYIRAFDDSGNPVGSSKCTEGKIYINTQSWAAISEIATKERAIQCMDSVREYLDTEYGLMLLAPPYSTFRPDIGALSSYVPGLKENASIWSHVNAWAIIAECILGRGDQAYEYHKKISPPAKNRIAEIHRAEPYVYAQTMAGKSHPDFGAARQSWLTGTASWMMKTATNWILGIRPQYHGLLVDPCIPKIWPKFTVTRHFRGASYEVKVENPHRVSKGIEDVRVDNRRLETSVLPAFADGKKHVVAITMG
ncbi:MAG: glycosyl transferase [Candidatus Thorarchaeota archaeon]|nr:MAG: glycosyl transferase [Candidatus Thorarchaeota archaeon]